MKIIGAIEMTPSKFTSYPLGSVTQKAEYETVARNIMVILARTGDSFRPLDWKEYKTERLKDMDFNEGEKRFFDIVKHDCMSAETARSFSPVWNKVQA